MAQANLFDELVSAASYLLGAHGPALPATLRSFAPADTSIHFFLQLALILLACRITGWLMRTYLGQPQVVGEMIAGIVLGPSLFGLVLPDLQARLFPPESKAILYALGQFGIGLFMFLVGTRLRTDMFRARLRNAAGISVVGMIVPFLAAMAITPLLMGTPGLFAPGLSQGQAMLFLGACIALTAFPMLARIIEERGLTDSPIGTLALAAGAFDDACSWCVLAIVLASFGGGAGIAILTIGGGLAFALFMLLFAGRLLAPLGRIVEAEGRLSHAMLAIILMLFCVSAFLMDAIGLHAVFGGFLLGVALPRGRLTEEIGRKLEPVTVVLLVPIFFAYSGLNTRLDMMISLPLLLVTLGILAVSIASKFGACWAIARLNGEDNATALGLGALMNARGLMELIIINIGLQKGLIGPPLFSMLALMAIVTTMMTGPLFDRVYGRKARAMGAVQKSPSAPPLAT